MSRRLRLIICSALALIAFGAGIFAYAHTQLERNNTANAEEGLPEYLVDKYGKIRVPEEPAEGDPRATRGTEGNPFFVLEIVPYEGMAEFGYQIAGCEPIDVDAAARDGFSGIYDLTAYYDINYSVTYRFWPEEKPGTFPGNETAVMNQYGTMTYVTDGSGNYNIVGGDGEGIDKKSAEYQPVAEGATGSFVWEPLSAEQCFAMTAEDKAPYEGEFKAALTDGTSFKMYFKDVQYVKGTGMKATHKNTFLRESIGLAYEFDADGVRYAITDENVIAERIKAYKSVVYTVTPEDLNMNPELVDRADLIVISPKMNKSLGSCPDGMYTYLQPGDSSMIDGSGKYLDKYKYIPYLKKHLFGYEEPDGQYGRKENKPNATFNTNLLDWSIVQKIAGRAMDDTYMLPVVMENKIFQNTFTDADSVIKSNIKIKAKYADGTTEDTNAFTGTQENMAKLYMILCQMKSSTFKTLYGNPGDTSNPLFSSQNMKVSGSDYKMKNNAYLQTGVFNYDNGRPNGEKGTADSRAYWNDTTLLPWHLMPTTGYKAIEKYSKAMAVYGIAVRSGGYDMTSGEAQNTLRNGLMGFDNQGQLNEGLDTMDCGIKNGVFGSQLYEYFDSINGSAPAPNEGDLTTADALFYLLNGVNGGPVPINNSTQYKILELQPSSNYERDTNSLFWKMIITTYTNSIADPEVREMTTSEFIGSHVECISEFDLIYVGMKKSTTDPTMQFSGTNYVYSHTGPKVTIGTTFSALYGWLRSEKISGLSTHQYNQKEQYFAYSGNDLTSLALAKLEAYNDAGFPILFGDGFYSNISGGSYTMANTIDRNSNIYQLGGIIDDSGSKAIAYGELDGSSPARAAAFVHTLTSNSQKVQMIFSQSPVLYDSNADEADRYINGYDDDRTLRFKFHLKAPAGTSYEVKLYVDSNTDGTYSASTEDIGASIYDAAGHGVSGLLQAGNDYTVERQITNRIGSIPWKLDLIKDGKVYASESGVSAIKKGPDDEVITINVLQIIPDPTETDSATVSLSLPISQTDANSLGGSAKKFYEKIETLDCFDITFYRMTQKEVMNIITGAGGATPQPDYLYQTFDMLVLGFADVYDGVSNADLLVKIQNYINRGKAVLYTHDTSSGIGKNGTDSLPVWGSTVTKAYRELFGMDRYGAKYYFDSATGDLSAIPTSKDKPYSPASSSGDAGDYYTNADGIPLIQGAANGILYRALYPEETGDSDANINAYEVSKVNTGAITQYPYTIPDTISVASTHPQYYQLDMEHSDIVVWYCLDGGTDGLSKSYETKYFGQSKNDVRNNYYIYNKGNVTYSGMGHMKWDASANSLSLGDLEIELFINTFVAAYRAAAVGVPVKVTNDDVTSNNVGNQFLCVDVDSANATEIIGVDINDDYHLMLPVDDGDLYKGYVEVATPMVQKSKRVYFELNDTNANGDDTMYTLAMKLNGASIQLEEDGPVHYLAVYRVSDNAFMDGIVNKYKKNETYYVDVPITIETIGTSSAVGKTELQMTVDLTFFVGEEPIDGEEKTTTISILPRGLYDLH